MPTHVIIVHRESDFRWDPDGSRLVTTREYISRPELFRYRTRVINLSRSYEYLGYGYYCSLLAEARQHRVIPSVKTILELGSKRIYRPYLTELDDLLRKRLKRLDEPPECPLSFHIFFGQADDRRFRILAQKIFDLFRCPILRVTIRRKDSCFIHAVEALTLDDVTEEMEPRFIAALDAYTKASWRAPRVETPARYSLAILHDPRESLPPSDERTLQKFVRLGETMDFDVELIQKKDLHRLPQFDALFLRETTALDHHTFRFAKRAEREGIPVIDDSTSILRCTNKVYLAELLQLHKIPTPRTLVVDRRRLPAVDQELAYPIVMKIPDGSFSRGVVKVENRAELVAAAEKMFADSDIILAQEFMFTEFDWRVGVLNGQPLFVCQYLMARKHWQIIKHGVGGRFRMGDFRTLPVEDVPAEVVGTALRATSLIGQGLYGVDLKENDRGVFVIEINDNPNIDTGVEDQYLKDELYRLIFREFRRRLEGRP